MRREDHENIAQCCHSLVGLVQDEKGESQREFTEDEFKRFIDRLVWAVGASPGGRLTDELKEDWHKQVLLTLEGCARSADPNKIIANRLMVLFEDLIAGLEDQRLDFDRFVKRCRGQMG